jgi:AcrR family transcriptional regulator
MPASSASGEPTRVLTTKGRQTQNAIERSARKLFAERGFHGTTLADITSAAGKSPAVFYRYFTDKEDLLAALAESFLHNVLTPSGLSLQLPDSPTDEAFFTSVVTGYWNIFKQNIGIMIAVAQLAATQRRFATVQNEFRRFGVDIVAASVRSPAAGLRTRAQSGAHRGGHCAAVRELHHGIRRRFGPWQRWGQHERR